MHWNWQQPDWPKFIWQKPRLARAEQQFLLGAGTLVGAVKNFNGDDCEQITIEVISTGAVTTSEIEGEILDRASVQSSIRPTVRITNGQPASWAGGTKDRRNDGEPLPLVRRSSFQRNTVRLALDACQRQA